LAAGKGPQNM